MTWEPKNKLDDEDVDVSDDEDKDNSFNREDKSGLLISGSGPWCYLVLVVLVVPWGREI